MYADAGSVAVRIGTAVGGNFESLAVNTAPAVTAVTDTIDTTTVSLTATPSVAEGGSIVYTASLTSAALSPVTVTLSNGSTIAIAAGTSSGSVSVAAPSDDVYVDAGSVSTTIISASGGTFENLAVNPAAATTAITDTIDTTTVSITGAASVVEGATAGYTVSLTSAAQSDVTVTLAYSGTAADGSDFNGVASVTIPTGSSSANFNIATIDDALFEGNESFTVSLVSATGGNFENLAISGGAGSVTTSLLENDGMPSIAVSSPSVVEGNFAVFTVSLSNASATPTTFTPVLASGTATVGTDTASVVEVFDGSAWVPVGGAGVTIPAGSTAVQVRVATIDDAIADSGETFTLTANVTAGTTTNVAATGTATLSDEAVPDTVLVSLSGPAAVIEGTTASGYTINLSQSAVTPVTVNLNYSGTATNGADYTGVVSVTIPAGASSATFALPTIDDVIADSGETIIVSLGSISGGGFEAIAANPVSNTVTTTISDEAAPDVTTVSLSATPSVAEGGSIVYTATLSNPANTAVTVNLSNGATINVAAGASFGHGQRRRTDRRRRTSMPATCRCTINTASGGNFEALAVNPAAAVTAVTDTIDATTVSLTATPSVAEGGSIVYTASLTDAGRHRTDRHAVERRDDQHRGGCQLRHGERGRTGRRRVGRRRQRVGDDHRHQRRQLREPAGQPGGRDHRHHRHHRHHDGVSDGQRQRRRRRQHRLHGLADQRGAIAGHGDVVQWRDDHHRRRRELGQRERRRAGRRCVRRRRQRVGHHHGGHRRQLRGAGGQPGGGHHRVTDTINTTTVSLTATPSVAEGGTIVYTASLTSAAQTPVTVTLSNGATISIAAGASAGSVNVAAPGDDVYADAGSVSATISSVSGRQLRGVGRQPAPAATAITDTIDTTTVSLSATRERRRRRHHRLHRVADLGGADAGQRDAEQRRDHRHRRGASTGSVNVAAPSDDVLIDAGSVSATISSATGGGFENLAVNGSAATTTITDTLDTTTVSLTATPSVAEGGSIVYTASLTAVAQTAVTVDLANGASITIAAGASSGTVSVPAPSDDVYVDAGSVSTTIVAAAGGNFESLVVNGAAATTTITDTVDTSTVSLTATPSVAEGGSIVYTASLSSAAQSPVTVTLSNGATIIDRHRRQLRQRERGRTERRRVRRCRQRVGDDQQRHRRQFREPGHQPRGGHNGDHRHDRHHHCQPDRQRVGRRRRDRVVHRQPHQPCGYRGDRDARLQRQRDRRHRLHRHRHGHDPGRCEQHHVQHRDDQRQPGRRRRELHGRPGLGQRRQLREPGARGRRIVGDHRHRRRRHLDAEPVGHAEPHRGRRHHRLHRHRHPGPADGADRDA